MPTFDALVHWGRLRQSNTFRTPEKKKHTTTSNLPKTPEQHFSSPRRAVRHLEKGRIIILAAGTGNPFFTTDSAASLRAIEIGAEVLLKATMVDGIYDSDPKSNNEANLFKEISFDRVLTDKLKVMVWSKKDNRLIYTKVKSLTLIEGDFETYTITKLSDGENYFANGFLQKTYSN